MTIGDVIARLPMTEIIKYRDMWTYSHERYSSHTFYWETDDILPYLSVILDGSQSDIKVVLMRSPLYYNHKDAWNLQSNSEALKKQYPWIYQQIQDENEFWNELDSRLIEKPKYQPYLEDHKLMKTATVLDRAVYRRHFATKDNCNDDIKKKLSKCEQELKAEKSEQKRQEAEIAEAKKTGHFFEV